MIQWPQFLVQEIADRRCIFFIGAGVSSSAKAPDGSSPKNWNDFICTALEQISSPAKATIQRLIDQKNYLLALQGIVKKIGSGDYYKLINDHFNKPAYEPSDLHKVIYDLDVRLVITTNFDKIYEKYCHMQSAEGYKTISYDSTSLIDDIRSDDRLIIKAHGSVNDINKMIFTKSQYHDAKRHAQNFYEVLKALFITNTVLFIGCSLNDPDVCLLLEEVNVIGSPAKPHYALIKKEGQAEVAIEDWKECYNISVLEFGPTYENLTDDLRNLFDQVNHYRIRMRIP